MTINEARILKQGALNMLRKSNEIDEPEED